MKKFFSWMFLALLTLGSAATVNAQTALQIDSFTKTAFTIDAWGTASYNPDTAGQVSFELLQSGAVLQQSPWVWVAQDSATHYQFTGLDTMTSYQVRINKFSAPSAGFTQGVLQTVTTDTIVTLPTIIRDSIQKFVSQSMIRYWHHGGNGYDTATVEVVVGTNQFFTGLTTSASAHLNFNVQSGYVQVTNLPQNQTLYIKARKHNSGFTSGWTTVDTFGLWTGTVIVNPAVTTDDSVANYNSVVLNGSATVSNLLRIRYGYSYSDVANSGGYVGGTVSGSQSSLSTSATVLVQPNTVIYYRAESETSTGAIYGQIKSVTSWNFPTMAMPVSWVDTTFTSADFIFTPNTSGISADSFIVEVGSPTLSFLEQRFHVGTVGVKNGSQQFAFTVSGLTAGTQYQLKITCYAFTGVIAATSSTVTFATPTPGTVQTSAATAEVTGVDNLVPSGTTTKSVIQLEVSSQNLASTGWLEINNDFDTTNFYTPLTFMLTAYNTATTSPVFVHQDVMTDDIPQNWDQYSDQYGRYIVRPVIYNSDNTGPYYGSWYYFFPRGVQTGITVQTSERIKVFPNPSTDYVEVQLIKEVPVVQIYDLMGNLLKEEKNTKNAYFTTTDMASGMYLVKFGATNKCFKLQVIH